MCLYLSVHSTKNTIKFFFLIAFIFLSKLGLAQETPKYILELADREQQFNQLSQEKGVKAAFLAVLNERGTVFRPEPINGKFFFKERKEDIPGQLSWEPTWIEVSSDGALGYTTGPFEYRNDPSDPQQANFGQYVSIWVKDKRKWELMLDLGISHAKPPFTPQLTFAEINPEYKRAVMDFIAIEQQKNSRELLKATDELYCSNLNSGLINESYKEYLAQNIRLLRTNNLPILGKTSATKYLNSIKANYEYKPNVAYVAASRDLGYTYGTVTVTTNVKRKMVTSAYNYVRIWRKEEHGYWKIALDIEAPIPPKNQ
ncbi:hypothetical protein [Solitalea koreensis]|uniref:DUF4440 domain-containing protein n=1 Tax=Solitalea koreensis TaxID=543615 RepID=A0A521CRT9_9SPHI|nr:hypothetical protein [Solitalea koreensis]SMO62142.1 hypothetical protein SAMN06265350_104291 [Solitalea koreensis]